MGYHCCLEYPYNHFYVLPEPSWASPALHPSTGLAITSTQDSSQNHQQQVGAQFASFYDSHGQMLPRHIRSKSAGVPQHNNGYSPNVNWRPPYSPIGIGLENTANRGSKSREELLRENLERLRFSIEAAYYIRPRDSLQLKIPNPDDPYPTHRKGSLSAPNSLINMDCTPRGCKSCLGSPNSDCEHNFHTTRRSDDLATAAKAKLCSECSAATAPISATQPIQDDNLTMLETPTQPTEAAQASESTLTAPVSATAATGALVQRTWS